MATNTASGFSADVEAYIQDETLPLARRQLVAYQFGDPLTLPEGRGTVWQAARYNRVPLPFASLSEGVAPPGETMTVVLVSGTCQQWGDIIYITDVAELTIKHPLFKKAIELLGLQIAETLERNTNNSLVAGTTQVNYVNSRGSRAALVAGDVLDTTTIVRTNQALVTLGAPRFMGDEMTDTKIEANSGGSKASANPRMNPHYTALIHPAVAADFRQNSNVQLAWSYSDLNRLYNYEIGEWNQIRFCESNMIQSWTGVAQVNGTIGSAGSLATNTMYIQVTGSDSQNQYESRVYQVSASLSVVGPTGSISVALPNLAGFTFSVYVGLTTSPANLGLSASGPQSGPLAGQAVQLAGNQTVIITGTGLAQTPPSAPATGLTVYPTYVIGRGFYGQVMLQDTEFSYLKNADKSDPLNQKRVVGWKTFYTTVILNTLFGARIESVSAYSATFG